MWSRIYFVLQAFLLFEASSLVNNIVRTRTISRRLTCPSMSIAVFGGSGLLGSEIVYQASQRGEDVVAFVRDPSKLVVPAGSGGSNAGQRLESDRIKVVKGSVTNYDDVEKAFEGNDVTSVIVALGGKTKDVGKTMLTDGTTNIIKVMKARNVKRISVVTSIGAGDSQNQAPFFFKVLMFTVMKNIFEDKNNQESLFVNGIGSDLEYTIVRPGGLTVEPPTGIINVISGEAGSISRADVADFCLGSVLDDNFPYRKQTPCISSVGGTSWVKDRSKAARGEM
jgi:putative NADH-flavin reductase